MAGKALAPIGFPVTPSYASQIDNWFKLTHEAVIFDEAHNETIQDNRKLPEMMAGIDHLYGPDSPAGLAIKAVLLHLSLDIDPDYPLLAPLTDQEIRQYIDKQLHPVLKALMLIDLDAWNLFDGDEKRRNRALILDAFENMKALMA